jgi:leader peptidase (prepilin peptidase)/N-methyltransferase
MNKPLLAASVFSAAPILLSGVYVLLAVGILRDGAPPVSVLIASIALASALVALSVIDLRTMRLPDALTLPLIAAGPLLVFALDWGSPLWHAGSAAAGFLALFALAHGYRALRGRAGLGLGDAKLFAAAGAWLGLEALPSVLLWATGMALLAVLLMLILKKPLDGSSRIAFGPFLSLGFWLVWLYGPIG